MSGSSWRRSSTRRRSAGLAALGAASSARPRRRAGRGRGRRPRRSPRSPADGASAAAPAAGTTVAQPAHQSLVTISASGDKAPLFIVHGAGGNVLFLWSLARAMAGSRPIYGFQAHGVDGTDMPDPTIEEMAARYVAELRAAHAGPYLLGGYSGGGIVTFEMVRQLQALGEEVAVRRAVRQRAAGPGHLPPGQTGRATCCANIRRHGYATLRPYIRTRVKGIVPRGSCPTRRRSGRADRDRRARARHPRRRGARLRQPLLLLQRRRRALRDAARSTSTRRSSRPSGSGRSSPTTTTGASTSTASSTSPRCPATTTRCSIPENAPRLAEVLTAILDKRGL